MEIDCLFPYKNIVIPVECKAAQKIKKTHLKGILSYLNLYKLKKGVVISLAPHEIFDMGKEIEIINIPLYAAENIWNILK